MDGSDKEEFDSLQQQCAWALRKIARVNFSSTYQICIQKKIGNNGKVSRYKARLLYECFMQNGFIKTYAPVADFTNVCVDLTLSVQRGNVIHQMGVLHSAIDQEVYIKPLDESVITTPTGNSLQLKED